MYKRAASSFEEREPSKKKAIGSSIRPASNQKKDFQQQVLFSTADRTSGRGNERPFSARETPARPDSTDLFTRPPSYRHKNGSHTRTTLRQSHRQLRHRNLSFFSSSSKSFSSLIEPFPTELFSSFSNND